MTVSPTGVTYGSSGNTLTFTFTANIGDFGSGSQVALTIPPGWTPPTTAAGAGQVTVDPGTATLSGSPPFAVNGSTILVDMTSCLAGQSFTITYANVAAPDINGSPYTFTVQTDIGSGGQGLVNTVAPFPTVTVNPAPLTVGAAGLTPSDKVYDGTTAATLTVGSPALVGVVGSDSVSLDSTAATGSFADKHVGTAKTVTIAGLALTGSDAAKYTLTQPTRTANITALPITVTAVAETKVYDGTTSAIGVPILSVATPLAAGDTAPVWTQTFADRNAGIGKSLVPAGAVVDGNSGLNYAYNFVTDTTGVITPLPITVTAVTDTKVYDGTTHSTGAPVLSAGTPLALGDTAPAWIQAFDTSSAGVAKALTPAGAVIDGNGGLNYSYNFVSVATGVITPAPITGTFTAETKVYDATTAAAVLTRALTGVLEADATLVSLTGGTANFDTAAVGNGKTVTLTGATLTGAAAGNYNLTSVGTTTANITPLGITGSFTAANKVYDGTTSATASTRTLNGVVSADSANVTLTGGTATFDTAAAGLNKTVTLAGATLSGTAAGNYSLTSVGTATATISRLDISGSFTAASKAYDGTTTATVLTRAVQGVLPADAANVELAGGTADFDTPYIGVGKTVTLAGATLTGTAAGNYSLASVATATADIATFDVTASFTAANKAYDGTTSATVLTRTLHGVLPADAANVELTGGTATFDSALVGAGKTVTLVGATLSGSFATNYNLSSVATATADITPRDITGNFTAGNKVYDGTTAATVLTRTLNGVLTADAANVELTGGTASFDSALVGAGKTVTLAGATITGTAAANYNLASVATATADITPLDITGSFTAENKVYDGTTTATALTRTLNGVLTADAANVELTGGTATFDTALVGAGKTVTLTGATITGTASGNYNLTSVGTATADITSLGITATFTAANKVYDGTTAATVLTRTLNGVLSADAANVELTGGTANFDTAVVGVGKTVTLAGATLTGTAAANYSLTSVATATADITPLAITGSFTAENKVYDGTTTATVLTRALNGVLLADQANVSLTGGTASFDSAPAGTGKPVTLTGAALSGTAIANYTLTSVATATADITAAPLGVTADSKTKTFGTADPVFTATYTGFVNGETNTVLGGTLGFTRDPGEALGQYAVTPSGLTSDNYAITYHAGTLTIVAPAPTIVALTNLDASTIVVTWSSVSNATYRVSYTADLSTGNWSDLSGDVLADGNTASKPDAVTTGTRFYRVELR